MSEVSSFDDLMGRLHLGDEDAAVDLFARFVTRLVGLCRRRLDERLHTIEDPEGIADSVLNSFIIRYPEFKEFDIDSWERLWGMLALIAVRKCINVNKRWLGPTKNMFKERQFPQVDDSHGSRVVWEPIANEATASQAAALVETVEGLMKGLDARQRQIVSLRLQGWKIEDIHKEVGRSERTIHRVLDRVKRQMQAVYDASGDSQATA